MMLGAPGPARTIGSPLEPLAKETARISSTVWCAWFDAGAQGLHPSLVDVG